METVRISCQNPQDLEIVMKFLGFLLSFMIPFSVNYDHRGRRPRRHLHRVMLAATERSTLARIEVTGADMNRHYEYFLSKQ